MSRVTIQRGISIYIFLWITISEKKNSKKMFLILYRKKKTTTTYINPVLVYATSALFMISILGVRDCSFCHFFGASLYRTLNSILCRSHWKTTNWLCSLEKKRESENVDHFCVFFNLFRERKLIKVFFLDVSVIFFSSWLMWVGRRKEDLFSLFFFIIHC